MSKQEDFRQEAIDYDDSPDLVQRIIARTGFEIGCEHGYQYAIDKACEWLTNYFVNYLQFDKQIISDFRKAMEE